MTFVTLFYPTASATAKGRSFSGPNIRLRPKVKISLRSNTGHWTNLHTSMTVSVNINMSKVSDKPIGIYNQTPFDSIPEIHYINKIMF